MNRIVWKWTWMGGGAGTMAMLATALATGCSAGDPGDAGGIEGEVVEVGEAASELVIGTYSTNGQTLTVHDLGSMSLLTSRLASCSDGVLYATRTDGTLTGMVDPYGWRAPAGIDPYGHYWARANAYDNVIGIGQAY